MSLIHEALKKAEREKNPQENRRPPVSHPILPDQKKMPPQRWILYGLLLIASIGLLVYFRFLKKSANPLLPQVKEPVAATPQNASKDSGALLEKGILLFNDENWKASLAFWEDLVLQRPIDPEIYNNMGLTYKKLKKNKEAYQSYEKALALHKDFPEAHNNLGVLLMEENRIPQAKDHLQNAILLKPDYADPYFNYALILEREGNFKEAKRNLETFLLHRPDTEAALKEKIEKKIRQLER